MNLYLKKIIDQIFMFFYSAKNGNWFLPIILLIETVYVIIKQGAALVQRCVYIQSLYYNVHILMHLFIWIIFFAI